MARGEEGWELAEVEVGTGAMTTLLTGVDDFAVADEGFVVVLDEGATLAFWDGDSRLLRRCEAPCRSPAVEGERVAWLEGEGRTAAAFVSTLRGDEARAITSEALGRPVVSPDGTRVAVATAEGLRVWAPGEESDLSLPLGEGRPSWSPDGRRLAVPMATGDLAVVVVEGGGFPQPLTTRADGGEGAQRLTEVAWSPLGEAIVFLRRRFYPPEHDEGEARDERPGAATLGPQPWAYVMPRGHVRELPGDAGASFARPVWSPDGRYLALVRLPVGSPGDPPEVWVVDFRANEMLLKVPGAVAPDWGR
jgi:Tol biopolymer transport system component